VIPSRQRALDKPAVTQGKARSRDLTVGLRPVPSHCPGLFSAPTELCT